MTGPHSKPLTRPMSDPMVRRMMIVCGVGLGGFLLWAGFAPLEEGVAAHGRVIVKNDRKVVQHFEGGIVSEIHVSEGVRVNEGDVLFVLKDTVSLAGRDQVIQDYAGSLAAIARLRALKDGAAEPDFSVLGSLRLGDAERADILERERDLFRQQKDAFAADLAVLQARRDAAVSTQAQRGAQIAIARRALAVAEDELQVIRGLFAEQLARRDQVAAAEGKAVSLEADLARLESDREAAAASERDLTAQIGQAEARFAQKIANDLATTRAELLSAEEQLGAAQDVLDRSVIRAPVSGEVLNLEVATVGGVIRPGETILEIIPEVGEVTAAIRIRPSDRASVFEGQQVRTRISAYKGWQVPELNGEVLDVSADLKDDPATGAVFYEARVQVSAEDLAAAGEIEITPGMPVDAFIYSGRSRTMADYLLAPVLASLFKGLRSS